MRKKLKEIKTEINDAEKTSNKENEQNQQNFI